MILENERSWLKKVCKFWEKKIINECYSWDSSANPREEGGLSWIINSWDTSLPYFSLTNLMKFLLLEWRKNWVRNICFPNILNLQLRIMGNKRKYKEIESDGPNKSPQRGESVNRWEKVKTQIALLHRWPRRMQKSSKPLKWIYQS